MKPYRTGRRHGVATKVPSTSSSKRWSSSAGASRPRGAGSTRWRGRTARHQRRAVGAVVVPIRLAPTATRPEDIHHELGQGKQPGLAGVAQAVPVLDGLGQVVAARRDGAVVGITGRCGRQRRDAGQQRLVGVLAHHGPADVEAQDVVGALPDGVHLGVAHTRARGHFSM